MPQPAVVMIVRFKSALSHEEATKIALDRLEAFRALEGLQQKYYLHDPATGEYAGLYLWRSPEDLDAFRQSELRASIGRAYQVIGEPRVEVYQMMMPLRDEATS